MSVRAESAERAGRSRARRARRAEADQHPADAGLDLLRVVGWLVLHDVALPGGEALMDHVIAGPSGVCVINTLALVGPVALTEDSLACAGESRLDDVHEVEAAAAAVRDLLDGAPVVPVLCFQRADAITGVVDGVAVCSTANILELVNDLPDVLSDRGFAEVRHILTETLEQSDGREVVVEPPVTSAPRRGRLVRRTKPAPVTAVEVVETVETEPVEPAVVETVEVAEEPVIAELTVADVEDPTPEDQVPVAEPAPTKVKRSAPRLARPGRQRGRRIKDPDSPEEPTRAMETRLTAIRTVPIDRRARKTSLMPAIVGALVIAGVLIGVPRVPHLVSWGRSFFASPPPTALGQPIAIDASLSHPALTVTAGIPTTVTTVRGQSAGKGHQFVAIPLTTLNRGTATWSLPVDTDLTIVDDLGVSHAPDPTVRKLRNGSLLARQVVVPAGKAVAGLVVFNVENGRTVREVLLSFGADAPDVWSVPTP
ncbi:MAG: hypothetical protein JWR52_3620 [Marmoricola sp.]|nr:hypothetical protein [Marmoricola sp.]